MSGFPPREFDIVKHRDVAAKERNSLVVTDQRVVLIGPMGAGKSTIGKLLARELGWPYIDNDAEIVAMTGMNAAELSQLSVPALHRFESECLADISNRPAPFVAGAAASVVDYSENIEILKSVTSIYLRIPLTRIVERAGTVGVGRENIEGDLKDVLRERFLRRDPIYREVSKFVIELGAIPHADAKRILSLLKD